MKKILMVAITLNGKIAKNSSHNADWTSSEDKKLFKKESMDAGVVVYGLNTFLAMGKPFPNRLNVVLSFNPEEYQDKQEKDVLEFTNDSLENIVNDLEQRGFEKMIIGGGCSIYSLFLEKKLVDEIYLTIAPKIFPNAMSLFKDMDIDDIDLELLGVEKLSDNGEILVRYKVKK